MKERTPPTANDAHDGSACPMPPASWAQPPSGCTVTNHNTPVSKWLREKRTTVMQRKDWYLHTCPTKASTFAAAATAEENLGKHTS